MTTKATAEQVRARARVWLKSEVERSCQALGPTWPLHSAWVLEYLRAELTERLARWRA